MSEQRRSLELEQEVDATPDEVWEALTTASGLERWFPLRAGVEPGEEGTVWLSWGPGCEGEAPIHVWDPPHRFGWTEEHGSDERGRPIRIAVDFHVEGRKGGSTVVRLVQSGFSASTDWDEMYDALKDGWRYFLFNLAFYFREHRGEERRMVWCRKPTGLGRDQAWNRLLGAGLVAEPDEDGGARPRRDGDHVERARAGGASASIRLDDLHPARIVSVRPGRHFAAVLPGLGNAIWFVELEGAHVGFWLSIYGAGDVDLEGLQRQLDQHVASVLGGPASVLGGPA